MRAPILVAVLFFAQTITVHGSYLRGKHLRIGYIELPPDIFTEHDNVTNTTVYRGVLVSMLQWMATRENFTYTLILIDYSDGFNSLPGELINKNLDLVLNKFGFRYGRNRLVHYLHPFLPSEHVLLIPFPKNEANVWSVFRPYTWTVWICFCLSGITMIFMLHYASWAKRSVSRSTQPGDYFMWSEASEYVIAVTTNQGGFCVSRLFTVRLLAGTWCLAAVVLVNAFSGSLITFLTVPKFTPIVSSLLDLANKSEPQILTRSNSFIRVQFETNSQYSPLRDNVIKYDSTFCGQVNEVKMDDCLSMVKKGGYVVALVIAFINQLRYARVHSLFPNKEKDNALTILNTESRKSTTCELTLAEESYEKSYGAAVIPLNSSRQLRNALDVNIMRAISSGLMAKWTNEFYSESNNCVKYRQVQQNVVTPLSIKNLGTAFVILALGTGVAVVSYLYKRFM